MPSVNHGRVGEVMPFIRPAVCVRRAIRPSDVMYISFSSSSFFFVSSSWDAGTEDRSAKAPAR